MTTVVPRRPRTPWAERFGVSDINFYANQNGKSRSGLAPALPELDAKYYNDAGDDSALPNPGKPTLDRLWCDEGSQSIDLWGLKSYQVGALNKEVYPNLAGGHGSFDSVDDTIAFEKGEVHVDESTWLDCFNRCRWWRPEDMDPMGQYNRWSNWDIDKPQVWGCIEQSIEVANRVVLKLLEHHQPCTRVENLIQKRHSGGRFFHSNKLELPFRPEDVRNAVSFEDRKRQFNEVTKNVIWTFSDDYDAKHFRAAAYASTKQHVTATGVRWSMIRINTAPLRAMLEGNLSLAEMCINRFSIFNTMVHELAVRDVFPLQPPVQNSFPLEILHKNRFGEEEPFLDAEGMRELGHAFTASIWGLEILNMRGNWDSPRLFFKEMVPLTQCGFSWPDDGIFCAYTEDDVYWEFYDKQRALNGDIMPKYHIPVMWSSALFTEQFWTLAKSKDLTVFQAPKLFRSQIQYYYRRQYTMEPMETPEIKVDAMRASLERVMASWNDRQLLWSAKRVKFSQDFDEWKDSLWGWAWARRRIHEFSTYHAQRDHDGAGTAALEFEQVLKFMVEAIADPNRAHIVINKAFWGYLLIAYLMYASLPPGGAPNKEALSGNRMQYPTNNSMSIPALGGPAAPAGPLWAPYGSLAADGYKPQPIGTLKLIPVTPADYFGEFIELLNEHGTNEVAPPKSWMTEILKCFNEMYHDGLYIDWYDAENHTRWGPFNFKLPEFDTANMEPMKPGDTFPMPFTGVAASTWTYQPKVSGRPIVPMGVLPSPAPVFVLPPTPPRPPFVPQPPPVIPAHQPGYPANAPPGGLLLPDGSIRYFPGAAGDALGGGVPAGGVPPQGLILPNGDLLLPGGVRIPQDALPPQSYRTAVKPRSRPKGGRPAKGRGRTAHGTGGSYVDDDDTNRFSIGAAYDCGYFVHLCDDGSVDLFYLAGALGHLDGHGLDEPTKRSAFICGHFGLQLANVGNQYADHIRNLMQKNEILPDGKLIRPMSAAEVAEHNGKNGLRPYVCYGNDVFDLSGDIYGIMTDAERKLMFRNLGGWIQCLENETVTEDLLSKLRRNQVGTISAAHHHMRDTEHLSVFTETQLRRYDNPGSGMYFAVGTDVYDIKEYMERHPGGRTAMKTWVGQAVTTELFYQSHHAGCLDEPQYAAMKIGRLIPTITTDQLAAAPTCIALQNYVFDFSLLETTVPDAFAILKYAGGTDATKYMTDRTLSKVAVGPDGPAPESLLQDNLSDMFVNMKSLIVAALPEAPRVLKTMTVAQLHAQTGAQLMDRACAAVGNNVYDITGILACPEYYAMNPHPCPLTQRHAGTILDRKDDRASSWLENHFKERVWATLTDRAMVMGGSDDAYRAGDKRPHSFI